jgi:hypothetical protein
VCIANVIVATGAAWSGRGDDQALAHAQVKYKLNISKQVRGIAIAIYKKGSLMRMHADRTFTCAIELHAEGVQPPHHPRMRTIAVISFSTSCSDVFQCIDPIFILSILRCQTHMSAQLQAKQKFEPTGHYSYSLFTIIPHSTSVRTRISCSARARASVSL